jgi:hypothetical protein
VTCAKRDVRPARVPGDARNPESRKSTILRSGAPIFCFPGP